MRERHTRNEDNRAAGSPPQGEPAFIAVGKLRRPHGVCGEILMEVLTDFPERLIEGMLLYVGTEQRPLRLVKRRYHRKALLVTFEGYETPETVGEFRNQYAFIPAASLAPLPEGEYYHHQILGLQVVDETGAGLGTIVEIIETGANDVYVVRQEGGRDILIPAIDPVILDVNLNSGKMHVYLLPGLVDK